MGLERGQKYKSPEQGDLFLDSLEKYTDPTSPEFKNRLADEVVVQLEKHKEERGYSHSIFLKVRKLLEQAGVGEMSGEIASLVHEKIRDRELAEGQAEMSDLASKKIRAEADARWTEDGISEQEQKKRWWQR